MGNEASSTTNETTTNPPSNKDPNLDTPTAAATATSNTATDTPHDPTETTSVQPKETLEQKLQKDIDRWKSITQNGVKGVCAALEKELHVEAAHNLLEDWEEDESTASVPDVKVVDKCIQVLIAMPSETSDYVQDRNTTRDMELFTNIFRHAIHIVVSFDQRLNDQDLGEGENFTSKKKRKKKTNRGEEGEDELRLSQSIHDHDTDDYVPTARKTIRGCLIFLSEVGKLTTTDGTDRWYGMKDAIKETHVVSIVIHLLHAFTTHNSFVFWGLNALYFCCRDGAENDWENIEEMRRNGGLELCETLRSTCSNDTTMLVHVQLLHTMMTMKDDDDEDLLDVSLAGAAQRVANVFVSPEFGKKQKSVMVE